MQGQKGSLGSLQESLDFEHGSTSSDSGVVELSMWSMGESSSSSVPNQVCRNRVDPKLGLGWPTSVKAHPEPDQHEPPASKLSLGSVNMNTTHTHATNGYHGHNVTVNPSTYIGKTPLNYASSSSGLVELDARLPRKRKAADLNIGQSSSGIESSNIFQIPEGGNTMWQSVTESRTPTNTMPFDPIIARLGSDTGGASSDNRALENIRRNVRIRVSNSRQQDQLPASTSISNSNGLLSFSSPYTSLELNNPVATGDSSLSHAEQPLLRVPALTRNLYASSRNRSSSSRASRPVASPISISDHPLFVQPHDTRNTALPTINWNFNIVSGTGNGTNDGNGNSNGIASTSNPVSNLRPHRGSSLYSSRRHTELLRRSLLSSIGSGVNGRGGQNSNLFSRLPPPVNASASSSQETGIPPVSAITGHQQHHHLARTSDRMLDGAFGFPYLSRAVAGGSERRGRLVTSEMRNVFDRIRRGEGLRFEDVMILDQSFFYGMVDIHDRHRDMRLDIDNMSYEELLALEERIGNVNTGLTDENICKHLKQKTFASVDQPEAEPCCICQEEYKNGDDLGGLDCGHEFHTGCIKQWLLQKNACPVCKSAVSK